MLRTYFHINYNIIFVVKYKDSIYYKEVIFICEPTAKNTKNYRFAIAKLLSNHLNLKLLLFRYVQLYASIYCP